MSVKVWIKSDQINKISKGESPDRYFTSKPIQEQNIIEMDISIEEFTKWQSGQRKESISNFGKKQLLND